MLNEFNENSALEIFEAEWGGEMDEVRRYPPRSSNPSRRTSQTQRASQSQRTSQPRRTSESRRTSQTRRTLPSRHSRGPYIPRAVALPRSVDYGFTQHVVESGGDEKIRWVQDCLNHKLNLSLPITGVANAETRSAIRKFQQERGIRANGLIDPQTEEVLKTFCSETENEFGFQAEQLETEIGPITAKLIWLPRPPTSSLSVPGDAFITPLAEARKTPGGGIYIMVGDAGKEKDKILKVGKTEFFSDRLSGYSAPLKKKWSNLRVYLARINRHIFKDAQIERAVTRYLFHALQSRTPTASWQQLFPVSRKVPAKKILGNVDIQGILPPPLLNKYKLGSTLSINASKTKSYEISPPPMRDFHSCPQCGTAPCRCPGKTCSSACACKQCQSAGRVNKTGVWLRQGNQIRVQGIRS